MAVDKKWIENLTKEFTDKGKIIEAGWLSLRYASIASNAPTIQIKEMRMAFFAGAQHLFGSIMSILDPGLEPTDVDLRRLDLINTELNEFINEYKKENKIEKHPN
jgi:hypothetical protein